MDRGGPDDPTARPLAAACVLATVAALGATGGALAQSSATLNLHGVEDAAVQVPGLGSSAGQVRGLAVHGENGDALGRVERVLATRGGRVVALAVEVEDGLLGLGDREVVLMLDQLRREGDRLVTPLTRAQIKAQPPWRR
jgi:hypothetical protein